MTIAIRRLVLCFIFCISNMAFADLLSNPYFYSITSPEGKESVIFGTLHGGVTITDVPTSIIQKLNNSKVLINEWTFSEQEIDAVLSGHLVEAQIKSFEHKGEDLTPELKARLVSDWGVDSRLASQTKSNDCSLLSFGGPISSGFLDFHLIDISRKQNKRIVSLDTKELIDSLKLKNPEPACDIRNIMNQITPEQFKAYQLNMITDYRNGNEDLSAVNDPLTEGRNSFWIQNILKEVVNGDAFIAVGVAHLYGPKGLIRLLNDNGYTVTRQN